MPLLVSIFQIPVSPHFYSSAYLLRKGFKRWRMIQEFSFQGIFWNADHRAETGLIQGKG